MATRSLTFPRKRETTKVNPWESCRPKHGIDAEAIADLYISHLRIYRRLAERYLCSTEDAEEAVQEAFLRAWRFRDGFHGGCELAGWVAPILRHECVQRLRERSARRSSPEIAFSHLHEPGVEDATFQNLDIEDRRSLVRRLSRRLPAGDRSLVLRVLAGEPLNMSQKSIKAARHRAVVQLRQAVLTMDQRERAAA